MDPIVKKYFEDHPEEKEGVWKATYAYHTLPTDKYAHQFTGPERDAKCTVCGRTRELVRWDDLPPECGDYYEANPVIRDVIRKEEEKYAALLKRCEKIIKKDYSDVSKLTGEILSMLHHTHGADPNVVEGVLEVELPRALHEEYLVAYEKHSQTGKKGFKPKVIKVQGM